MGAVLVIGATFLYGYDKPLFNIGAKPSNSQAV